jgi:hypothetical protein
MRPPFLSLPPSHSSPSLIHSIPDVYCCRLITSPSLSPYPPLYHYSLSLLSSSLCHSFCFILPLPVYLSIFSFFSFFSLSLCLSLSLSPCLSLSLSLSLYLSVFLSPPVCLSLSLSLSPFLSVCLSLSLTHTNTDSECLTEIPFSLSLTL